MEELIKASKNQISIVFLALIILSCSTSRIKDSNKTMKISFGSVYENEKLTLSINDSTYYLNRYIKTNSLGTDPTSYISIEADKIHLKGEFIANIDPKLDKDYIRKLKIDTVLYRNKGHRIIIGANYDAYYVSQQDKKFKVE